MFHTLSSLLRRLALATALLSGGAASAGTIHIAIDTAGLGAASGYLDMQLSAGTGVPLATAIISNLSGFDSASVIESWGVTALTGGYQFRNDIANDLFHWVSFGGVLSFDLTFSGQADPLTRYVSHFMISAFDENIAPLGNYNPVSGALADFSWTPGLHAQQPGTIGMAISDERVSVVPEPATWMMMGLGLMAMTAAARRRREPDA